ncbi:NADH dehydrogenase subunit 5 [Niallia sp. Krafla_26]|uniref:NADH dehydrogenase subunit 5 n=1 Tax=Niallia sp. Krafla_26 TaxID=3064703 RepID=UPI003D1628C6
MSFSLPILFLIAIMVSLISSFILLHPKVSLEYIRIHIGIVSIPPILALLVLIFQPSQLMLGPWRFSSLTLLLAVFVLTMGLIVQRFSVHYLLGDRSYRKYFFLLSFTTIAGSLAWLSDDLRLLIICWGITLLGLTLLMLLKKEWAVARRAASYMGRLFMLSWLLLLVAILWMSEATGHWQLSQMMTTNGLAGLESWEMTSINLLIILSVVIPAAQWPFQRWLLDSVVAPTPISAIMHAGIVNAGGILLTFFAPLFNGGVAQIILLILSGISVLMGTGIMLVQVDYKRQLVGSTIAQMGFMLIQCALGAYVAAIIHAVLHGLFKSTLFLQAGSAIHRDDTIKHSDSTISFAGTWSAVGLGIMAGIGYGLTSPDEGYRWISAIILGCSVTYAWKQLVASGYGRIGRLTGFTIFIGGSVLYGLVHSGFHSLLHEYISNNIQPSLLSVMVVLFILVFGSGVGFWLLRNPSSKAASMVYLWLLQVGEPHTNVVESHPNYLRHVLFQGGKKG